MAVIYSSTTQALHHRQKHGEETGCKCRSMAFLEECSDYFPEFLHSVTRSWKWLNLNISRVIQSLQIQSDVQISNGQQN
jgi:hypothetical protein